MKVSKEQKIALEKILNWYNDGCEHQFITLGGYAGTGKTSLIAMLRSEIFRKNKKLKIAFCSYTGKATRVLKYALTVSKAVYKGDSIGTIHSLIYSPLTNSNEEIVGWERKEKIGVDLIIIDEASMVDEAIWNDLLSYKIPIIAVGDHGQLPPINGKFNLMGKPEIKLEQIHRQKKGNPIIELSVMARETGNIPPGNYGKGVIKVIRGDGETTEIINEILDNYSDELLILCGYNSTRIKLNKYIRSKLEIASDRPVRNDRIICLRNNHEKNIFNGMLGRIKTIDENDEHTYLTSIEFDDETDIFRGPVLIEQFNNPQSLNFSDRRKLTLKADLVDYGYALTVHKAQGSQARKVLLFEERFPQMDDDTWKKWLYTAVTRAQEELIIVGN